MIGWFAKRFDYVEFLKNQGVKDPNDCMTWAFGPGYATMFLRESNAKWNERHGHLFMIMDSDLFIPSMEKIAKAYVALPEKKV